MKKEEEVYSICEKCKKEFLNGIVGCRFPEDKLCQKCETKQTNEEETMKQEMKPAKCTSCGAEGNATEDFEPMHCAMCDNDTMYFKRE
jgi:hypothetical protein